MVGPLNGKARGYRRVAENENDTFLPRDASAERGDATVSRPSVCP